MAADQITETPSGAFEEDVKDVVNSHATDIDDRIPSNNINVIGGQYAMQGATHDNFSVILGIGAGEDCDIGRGCIFIGASAGNNASGGVDGTYPTGDAQYNIAIGVHSFEGATAGKKNTFVGTEAGSDGNNGDFNSGFGTWSLDAAVGDYNTGLGSYAGWHSGNITGDGNTYIGAGSGVNEAGNTTFDNVLVIGNKSGTAYNAGYRPSVSSGEFYLGSKGGFNFDTDYNSSNKRFNISKEGLSVPLLSDASTAAADRATMWIGTDKKLKWKDEDGTIFTADFTEDTIWSDNADAAFTQIETNSSETLDYDEKVRIAAIVDGIGTTDWAVLDYFFHPLKTSAKSCASWVSAKLATAVGSPTFTSGIGFTLNGTTQYLDSGFNVSTDGTNYTQNSATMGARIDGVSTGGYYGSSTSGGDRNQLVASVDNIIYNLNGAAGIRTLTGERLNTTDTLYLTYRSTSTNIGVYKNGTSSDSGYQVSASLHNLTQYIGAVNSNGTAINYYTGDVATFLAGGIISNHSNLNTVIQANIGAL